jgi:nucleoside-diphosphate-sugar epimerase
VSRRPLLVTGATGFVGRHVLVAAADASWPALALARDAGLWSSYDWTSALGDVSVVTGDVTEPEAWSGNLPSLGGIAHLAAVVHHSRHAPDDMLETNVRGTLAMVRLAAQHRCRLVVVSTSGTVGCFDGPEDVAFEDAPFCEKTVSRWPYYRSKIRMEREARALADELDVELVFLRPPILLGPGDHRYRSTRNVLKALRRKLPFIIGGGMHFADVRDAARALIVALERPDVQPVYHLEGTMCELEHFFGMLEEVSGVPRPRFVLPYRPAWWLATAVHRMGVLATGEPPHLLPDPVVVEMARHYWGARSLHAEADLGYKPRDPRETLRDTAAWLRENHEAFRSQPG